MGVYANFVLAVIPLVLNKNLAFGTEGKITISHDVLSVEKVNVFEDDEGADEGRSDSVWVGSEEACQFLGKAVPD
jgi:hypothetical protein